MSSGLEALRSSKRGNQPLVEKEIEQPVLQQVDVEYRPSETNRGYSRSRSDREPEVEYRRQGGHRTEPFYEEPKQDSRSAGPYYNMGDGYQEVANFEDARNPRYQNSRTIPVDRVPSQTEMVISKPDRFGLQVLGMNSNDNIRIIKPRSVDIQPLVIQNITDVTGKVSAKLEDIMFKTGATVLPLRECGVFENITSITGFQLVEYKGKRYASYCGVNYPTSYQDKLINTIVSKLSSALNYGVVEDDFDNNTVTWDKEESRLSKIVTIGGKEVEIPSLCVSELEYICTRLKLYNCNVVEVFGDFPHLIVGIDLEGVEVNEGDYPYRR